ncbi:mitochondrial ribosomal protein L22 isoform X2 [Tachypleus tridentatus]|uniref:mitochondrial ribosomal protein L22 isoform X2 n=1 Tax=Tachypleus tridentatus TaxID=6853 RepID=UPI003FD1DAFD
MACLKMMCQTLKQLGQVRSKCFQSVTPTSILFPSLWQGVQPCLHFHVGSECWAKHIPGVRKWPKKNDKVYPPQAPGEERRPAFVCHYRNQIKYSPDKLWYIATMIKGMSVEEAIKQLSFVPKKGAQIIKEVLKEAQELAVKEHNVEYKSNLWVAESNACRGQYVKGIRKHARRRLGEVHYKYCHYLVRLVEGPPPPYYFEPEPSGNEKLQQYLDERRNRKIILSL